MFTPASVLVAHCGLQEMRSGLKTWLFLKLLLKEIFTFFSKSPISLPYKNRIPNPFFFPTPHVFAQHILLSPLIAFRGCHTTSGFAHHTVIEQM